VGEVGVAAVDDHVAGLQQRRELWTAAAVHRALRCMRTTAYDPARPTTAYDPVPAGGGARTRRPRNRR
ncbi:hypothetical protein ABT040_33405, partial [Streptomyces sp. NPDC002688]|uniref:hypothetical protein n=1 Tax=Streptomyces sp. NPDC002688 TaxID=3154423 RepID=UPI00332607E4